MDISIRAVSSTYFTLLFTPHRLPHYLTSQVHDWQGNAPASTTTTLAAAAASTARTISSSGGTFISRSSMSPSRASKTEAASNSQSKAEAARSQLEMAGNPKVSPLFPLTDLPKQDLTIKHNNAYDNHA
jgi:hypothetical protein